MKLNEKQLQQMAEKASAFDSLMENAYTEWDSASNAYVVRFSMPTFVCLSFESPHQAVLTRLQEQKENA